jgi:hypothetical protein
VSRQLEDQGFRSCFHISLADGRSWAVPVFFRRQVAPVLRAACLLQSTPPTLPLKADLGRERPGNQ